MAPHIPNELFARIGDFADLMTVKSLRHTNSDFKVAVPLNFAERVKSIHVSFTEAAVHSLSQKIATPMIRATVKELVLSFPNPSRSPLANSEAGFDLFDQIARHVNRSLPACHAVRLFLESTDTLEANERREYDRANVSLLCFVILRRKIDLFWPFDTFSVSSDSPEHQLERLPAFPLIVFEALKQDAGGTHFRSLKRLHLPFYVYAGQNFGGHLAGCQALWRIVQSMPKLTHLHLGFLFVDEECAEPIFDEMIRMGGNVPLTGLDVEGLLRSFRPIQHFLTRYGACTAKLKLKVRIPFNSLDSLQQLVETLIEKCQMLRELTLLVLVEDDERDIVLAVGVALTIDRASSLAVRLAHEVLTDKNASVNDEMSRRQLAIDTQVAAVDNEQGQEQHQEVAQIDDGHDIVDVPGNSEAVDGVAEDEDE